MKATAKKKPKKTISLRLNPDHIKTIREKALSEDRSISAVTGRLISKGIEAELKSK